MFTHLSNGCPMQMNRHDNIIRQALSYRDSLWLCFIANGVHVPFFMLRNYLDLAGIDRYVVVTDAVAPAGLGPGPYRVSRWELQIGADFVAQAADGSHRVGSVISMPRVRRHLIEPLGCSDAEVDRLVSENPRRAAGIKG